MKQLLIVFTSILLLYSCGGKKEKEVVKSTTIDNEFTEQFASIQLPINITDTGLDRTIAKEKIIKTYGKKYFPDSLVQTFFTPDEKVNYYAIGKTQNEDQEVYILMKGISGDKKAAFLMCYDNQLHYKDGALLCKTDVDSKTSYLATIKKDLNILIRKTETVKDGEPILTESNLAYNNAGYLREVVTNFTDEDLDLTNPFDTFPQKKKFTGDYYIDKKNFISLRDGKDSGELLFFYHYEKEKNDCTGEIKSSIKMTGATSATFLQDGDPCVMNFQFSNSQVLLKEDHGCGNKRPLDCTLNGVFTKKNSTGKPIKKEKALELPKIDPATLEPIDPAKKGAKLKSKANKPKNTTRATTTPVIKPVTPKKSTPKQPDI
jgi:hypothetical protein